MNDRAYNDNAGLRVLVALSRDAAYASSVPIIREALEIDLRTATNIGEGHRIAALKDALADTPDPTQKA